MKLWRNLHSETQAFWLELEILRSHCARAARENNILVWGHATKLSIYGHEHRRAAWLREFSATTFVWIQGDQVKHKAQGELGELPEVCLEPRPPPPGFRGKLCACYCFFSL